LIKLICDDQLLYNTLSNYLIQKDLMLTSSNKTHQIIIEIQDKEKSIILNINGDKIDISLPIDINFLNSQIVKKVIDVNFPIGSYKYFPYQRVISNQNKRSLLSDIQNLIISNLIIKKEGIDKDDLYNLIWKRDKSIYINKLDTHLTNLKKKLKQELNLKINFQSQNKILRLLID
tara:strand:- start:154 stop:678 length:525 start_codon:yes stop_codon:yes gene_type:complete